MSYAYAATMMLVFAYFFLQIDFAYVDTFRMLSRAAILDWSTTMADAFRPSAEYRPLFTVGVKVFYELVGPKPLPSRVYLVAIDYALCIIFCKITKVGSCLEWLAFCTALNCLVGSHTASFWLGGIGLPPNVTVITLIASLFAIQLLFRRQSVGNDVALVCATLVSMFSFELGIAVPAAVVVGYTMRLPGRSLRGLIGVLIAIALYVCVRFDSSMQGVPAGILTETGFGFGILTVPDQQRLFGSTPVVLYAYNIACTILTVLFSEPRGGNFVFVHYLLQGQPPLWEWNNVISSTLSTVLIGVWAAGGRWKAQERQLFTIAGALFLVNCALGFLYTRDRIPALAGVLYAVMLFIALRYWLRRLFESDRRRLRFWGLSCVLGLVLVGWTLRAIDTVVFGTRAAAREVQAEWIHYGGLSCEEDHAESPCDPRVVTLRKELRNRALRKAATEPCRESEIVKWIFEKGRC